MSQYDTIANANHSVPLDHLSEPCRAVLTRVDELCTLQTTNYSSTGNHELARTRDPFYM